MALIPANTKAAAARGFIRTASQSLATGFIIPAGVAFGFTQEFGTAVLLGVGSAIVSAGFNGVQSYFSILSKGIPEDYETLDAG